ncbi:MAG: hypothetical protein A49_11390 [Methyloceanibacter sp.]|nr:MAG: hypothetical protein A49_11390 [Methyloceanibacter sp.]
MKVHWFRSVAILGLTVSSSHYAVAQVGAVRAVIVPQPRVGANWCAIGLAFDGTSLYVNRCSDPNIYKISPANGTLLSTFDPGIPERPNAMAFDAKRNGLWIGTQRGQAASQFGGCGNTGMPIYFWDFDDNSVALQFVIPLSLINPATGQPFFFDACFLDGLAYRENEPLNNFDDELWCSDSVSVESRNIAVFRPDGSFVRGLDARSVDVSLDGNQTGLAIGANLVYLANDGDGDIYRADATADPLVQIDQFTSGVRWEADMECDAVSFAPAHVMWVRSNPQGNQVNDVITAYEVEPGGCGTGPLIGACCDPNDPPCRDVPQAACQGTWHEGVPCAEVQPPCFSMHRVILLDRTGSMQNVVLPEGDTLCDRARKQAKAEVISFFMNKPPDSSVAIWTFRGNGPTPLTAGFVAEAEEALAALATLEGVACSNLTPLAESICSAVDSIVGTFPTEPYQSLEISIISDGLENNSSGPCAGPASQSGMACGEFDSGSWQQKVCDHVIGNAVAITTLWGDICDGCLVSNKSDVETGSLLGPGVPDAVFFRRLPRPRAGPLYTRILLPRLLPGRPRLA